MNHLLGDNDLRAILPAIDLANVSRAHFSNPESLCRYISDTSESAHWCNAGFRGHAHDRGTANISDAIQTCLNGWQDGATRVARLRDKIIAARPRGPLLCKWDIGGAYPSVQRYLAGDPMHMRRIDSSRMRRKPVLTIVHHIGGLGDVSAESFANKAAVMAAIIDVIEDSQYQVELIGVSVTKNDDFAHETAFTVKEAGAALDIGRLAFAMGHPSMLRRLTFAVRTADAINKPISETMGQTMDYRTRPDGLYILPSLNNIDSNFSSEQRAGTIGLGLFIDILRKQDCPAFQNQEAA